MKKTKKPSKKTSSKPKREKTGIERRRHERRAVLDTFHVFITINSSGSGKYYLKDLSESGFALESSEILNFTKNNIYQGLFFINSGLSIPIQFRVAHIIPSEGFLKAGCELVNTSQRVFKAYTSFVKLLDQLVGVTDFSEVRKRF